MTLELGPEVAEYGRRNLLLWLDLVVAGQSVSTNLALFCRPKHLSLAEPEIEWKLTVDEDGRQSLTLTAQKPALWVWLEIEGERRDVSDNFFHLYPGQPHTIILKGNHLQPESAIAVHSLYDTYQQVTVTSN
jgi:beta-mannosidase